MIRLFRKIPQGQIKRTLVIRSILINKNTMKTTRRDFLTKTSIVSAGLSLGLPGVARGRYSQLRKGPKEYVIVMGHYDIFGGKLIAYAYIPD